MTAPVPSPLLAAWAAEALGGPCRFAWTGSAVTGSRVWQARRADGRAAYLKELSSRRKHEQERRALAEWAPRLQGLLPRLLGALDEPPALLIAAVPGRPADAALGSRELELAAHRAAGAALGRLHALEVPDEDEVPLSAALPRRLEAWLERASGALPPAVRAVIARSFGDGSAFQGIERAPCHRDVEPRNWVVELDEGRLLRLSLVDFEHARPDCRLVDFVKLECGAWRGRPDLRAELLEGHGGPLGEVDEDRLRRLALLHLVATLVRAGDDGDDDAATAARAELDRRLS